MDVLNIYPGLISPKAAAVPSTSNQILNWATQIYNWVVLPATPKSYINVILTMFVDWCNYAEQNPDVTLFTAALVSVICTYYYLSWVSITRGTPRFVTSNVDNVQRLMSRMPTLYREPCPPMWCTNPHLQFGPWMLQGYIHQWFFPIEYQRIENITPCGQDKSVLDVVPSFEEDKRALPIVIIFPGLRGHSQDCPGIAVVKRFKATNKFRTIVHHRRGHVVGESIEAGVFHFVGDSDDLSC